MIDLVMYGLLAATMMAILPPREWPKICAGSFTTWEMNFTVSLYMYLSPYLFGVLPDNPCPLKSGA
jgi:hypothetical protein